MTAQYVWSPRYVDAPVCRDRDTDASTATGDLGKADSGLDERLFYVTDANFNVTAVIQGMPDDPDLGKVVERYAYDPYGKVLVLDGADGVDPDTTAGDPDEEWQVDADGASDVANEILFCGYRFDAETSLYHVRHRMYHPTLGRWLQRDPLGYVDGMSLYEYCSCNATNTQDPSGRAGEGGPRGWKTYPDGSPTEPGQQLEDFEQYRGKHPEVKDGKTQRGDKVDLDNYKKPPAEQPGPKPRQPERTRRGKSRPSRPLGPFPKLEKPCPDDVAKAVAIATALKAAWETIKSVGPVVGKALDAVTVPLIMIAPTLPLLDPDFNRKNRLRGITVEA